MVLKINLILSTVHLFSDLVRNKDFNTIESNKSIQTLENPDTSWTLTQDLDMRPENLEDIVPERSLSGDCDPDQLL